MALALTFAGAVFAFATFREPTETAGVRTAVEDAAEPLSRSDPGVEPWREELVGFVEGETEEPEPEPEPAPEYEPRPAEFPEPLPEPPPKPEPAVQVVDPRPAPDPPEEVAPEPTNEPEPVDEPEPYELPEGAIMALSVDSIDLREVPVFDSVGARALKYGVGHHPNTSLPWSAGPHRNVYIAGHRVGFPGTASDRVFGSLENLGEGDEVVLRGNGGARYRYEVAESFVASPEDSWVKSRVRGEDMVTLQTCVGPNFSERLIVRAERV
jgi:sortase A